MNQTLVNDWVDHQDHTPEAERRDHAPIGADNSRSELLERMQFEFAGTPPALLAEIMDFLKEQGVMGGRSGPDQKTSAVLGRLMKILRYIKNHPNSTAIYAALYVWDEPLWDDLNGHKTQTEFAAELGVTKAAVNNAVKDAARYFGMPPRQDQRKPEACETMRKTIIARLEQQSH